MKESKFKLGISYISAMLSSITFWWYILTAIFIYKAYAGISYDGYFENNLKHLCERILWLSFACSLFLITASNSLSDNIYEYSNSLKSIQAMKYNIKHNALQYYCDVILKYGIAPSILYIIFMNSSSIKSFWFLALFNFTCIPILKSIELLLYISFGNKYRWYNKHIGYRVEKILHKQ